MSTAAEYFNVGEFPGEFAGDHPVKANTLIRTGAHVSLDSSGNAEEATSTATGFVIGVAVESADNTGGQVGDVSVRIKRGVFSCALDATNPPTKAYVGQRVWFTAPDTVGIGSTGTCRGGILLGFDGEGRAIVESVTKGVAPVTLGNANSEISGLTIGATYSQAEVTALRDKCEELADDVRALAAAINKSL